MSYTPSRKFKLGRRLLTFRVDEEENPLPWTSMGPRGAMPVLARERTARLSYDGPKRHGTLTITPRHAGQSA